MLFLGLWPTLKPAKRSAEARNWLMHWKAGGSEDWIPWEDFVRMPEEAFDHFPANPKNREHSYIRTTTVEGVQIGVIRQHGTPQTQSRNFVLDNGIRLQRPLLRLYKIIVITPAPTPTLPSLSLREPHFADRFNEAMLKAVQAAKGLA